MKTLRIWTCMEKMEIVEDGRLNDGDGLFFGLCIGFCENGVY